MSNPPFLPTNPKPIPSLSSPTASSSAGTSSSFGTPKSSISRKKPLGLDISKSILKPTRAAPGLPTNGDGVTPRDTNGGGGNSIISEAERLREEIAHLQLSSKSTSSTNSLSLPDSPINNSSSHHSDSSTNTNLTSSSSKRKSGDKEKKRSKHKDKDGEDLVKDEDLSILSDLGAGNGGTVTKVWNKKRNCVMARKLILVDAKPSVRKQILRELQIMNDCNSPYIVGYYGCFPVDVHVGIVLELMDAGSLNDIYRHTGPIPIEVVGKVAEAVLHGLMYLYDVHRIIHRDIKPSNILANTKGEIKICDFGVSGELINSIANTFVGTSTYMSPERIQGAPYTIKSDVWSLGISLIELALGRFPFTDSQGNEEEEESEGEEEYDEDPTLPLSTQRPKISAPGESKKEKRKSKGVSLAGGGHTMSILDLLQHIVNEPAPRLVSKKKTFPSEATTFVEDCLYKDPNQRKSPQELLASDWISKSKVTQDDLKTWALSTITKD
ncbi:STE/STE7/MEK1 protein kinase [Kwoniella mangroviensis CBS 8886]|uniref:uncharacterized protein n=1 Tax=Kwoniella mangroviensis CBS 8507 TaxID=1296122 RepID=UPI00080D6540|nr:STE/STE7/MEK1 protein kinase [Kwoniella mangroviensis CBS 8507]OCF63954.1 STE/STE7/MEK1 protein kinase [Kwoniella mangroviensis CBS 8507]OCF73866.1 STE/STE7/MEK1 protein kinase [Kwoniella mangroviensis CBS 8886]